MTSADFQAISTGLSAITQRNQSDADMDLRRAMLARQTANDSTDEEMRRKLLAIQQQQADDTTSDRKDSVQERRDALKRQVDADTWAQNPQNPANIAHAAQAKLAGAQADAIVTKPQSPIGATVQGIDEFSDAMSKAFDENQQALNALQANPQDPVARQAATKAQLKLSALSEAGKTMVQKWKPQAEPDIDVEIPGPNGDDGLPSGKLKMKVPLSQWNPQHPLWSKFNPPAPTTPPVGADGIPTLTPQQAMAAKPGTKFRTLDGRVLIR